MRKVYTVSETDPNSAVRVPMLSLNQLRGARGSIAWQFPGPCAGACYIYIYIRR